MGDNVTFESRLKKTHGPLRSNAFIYGIPHTRTKDYLFFTEPHHFEMKDFLQCF